MRHSVQNMINVFMLLPTRCLNVTYSYQETETVTEPLQSHMRHVMVMSLPQFKFFFKSQNNFRTTNGKKGKFKQRAKQARYPAILILGVSF